MFNKSIILKILSAIPITLLICSVEIIMLILGRESFGGEVIRTFQNHFYGMAYQMTHSSREQANLMHSMFGLAQPFIFNLLFGTHFYKDLHVNSIYYLTRQKKRSVWYYKKSVALFIYTGIYCFFQLIIPLIIAAINAQPQNIREALLLFVSSFLAFLFFTFLTTFMINILSLKFGSAFSFIIVYVFTVLCFYCSIYGPEILFFNGRLSSYQLNPIDNTMILWHGGFFEKTISILINFIYVLIMFIIGHILINRVDVGLTDKESVI